jgi:GT2 family glycosyltransferase
MKPWSWNSQRHRLEFLLTDGTDLKGETERSVMNLSNRSERGLDRRVLSVSTKRPDLQGRPELSVVIPSYRSGRSLFRCLESVYAQNTDLRFEVVVVDSSPESIGPPLQKAFPRARFIPLARRTLSGRARSIGAERARGRIVFFTDADCEVDAGWMKRLLEGHRSGYAIVGGSIENGTPHSFVGTAEYLLEFNEMNPSAESKPVRALPSCNLSVDRSVFKKVGAFPDFLKGEDTIFCERAFDAGFSILFKPDARIRHHNRTDLRHFLKNQIALGEGANETRRRVKRHGAFLITMPFLVFLIPVYRTWIIGKRLWLSDKRLFMSYVVHYPLILPGLLYYTWGFIRGPHRSRLSTESPGYSGVQADAVGISMNANQKKRLDLRSGMSTESPGSWRREKSWLT